MQKRKFKKINLETSLLGLGCMRLPSNEDGSVDEETAIKLIRKAIDNGINYVDTAFTYHGGKSEKILGKALADGYRDKIILADKMPAWVAKDEESMKSIFYKQLERLNTDHIDMYLIHNVTRGIWKRAKKVNVMPFLEEMKAAGKIKHIGFSFHDTYDFFEEMLDEYPWDFCQIQLNYMDKNHQAGYKGLKLASEKGLGVVIMEPLKGGRLTDAIPPSIQTIFNKFGIKRSPTEWAFKWLANMPELTVMLSGMSSLSQLEENIKIFNDESLNELSDRESNLINDISDEYNSLIKYSCTGCNYCMPCPSRLEIPRILRYLNDWEVYEQNPSTKLEYTTWIAPGTHASDCIGCKECESKCPQGLPISIAMNEMAKIMGV